MERLSDKAIDIINELHTDRLDYTSEYLPLIDASDLLAAYEDTGLVPEEINTLQSYKLLDKHERGKLFEYQNLGCTIERLRELAKADKDGRLVVKEKHPCDICTNLNCDGLEAECVWGIAYSKKNECCTYDCMMNREGSCLGGFYDQCGAQTDTYKEDPE